MNKSERKTAESNPQGMQILDESDIELKKLWLMFSKKENGIKHVFKIAIPKISRQF